MSIVVLPATLGSLQLYEIICREVFAASVAVRPNEVRDYCQSRLYRIGANVDGALNLLVSVAVLQSDGDYLRPGKSFDRLVSQRELGIHLAGLLVEWLAATAELPLIFVPGSLSWGRNQGEVHVRISHIPYRYFGVLGLLRELNALRAIDDSNVLLLGSQPFSDLLVSLSISSHRHRSRRGTMSPEALQKLLDTQAIQGAEAENFVINFERRRLTGHPNLEGIRRISVEDVAAGFDIESFSSKRSVIPDRFIEVKSFSGQKRFFVSSTEIEMGTQLSDTYYLYVVDASRCRECDYQPEIIGAPFPRLISEDQHWEARVSKWEVISLGNHYQSGD